MRMMLMGSLVAVIVMLSVVLLPGPPPPVPGRQCFPDAQRVDAEACELAMHRSNALLVPTSYLQIRAHDVATD